MMNAIRTEKRRSIYEIYDVPYDDIIVDGVSFDELLDSMIPGRGIKGLVTATSGWLIDEKDEDLVWERLIPPIDTKNICPLLICPDDQDFSCTTIVVEIENSCATLKWNRVGINKSYEFGKYDLIGRDVYWFPDIEPFEFGAEEYRNAIKTIRGNRGLSKKVGNDQE
jgi:hypothetical protein